ncbi:hypothetical protein [Mucilaginibacter lacusdianchii]|nr:hypothetical protein [Mucilaginibacter sp. JXJ CY 39]
MKKLFTVGYTSRPGAVLCFPSPKVPLFLTSSTELNVGSEVQSA